jgi:hypothetical protein
LAENIVVVLLSFCTLTCYTDVSRLTVCRKVVWDLRQHIRVLPNVRLPRLYFTFSVRKQGTVHLVYNRSKWQLVCSTSGMLPSPGAQYPVSTMRRTHLIWDLFPSQTLRFMYPPVGSLAGMISYRLEKVGRWLDVIVTRVRLGSVNCGYLSERACAAM